MGIGMIKLWSLLTENFQLANKVYAGQLSAADIDFLGGEERRRGERKAL